MSSSWIAPLSYHAGYYPLTPSTTFTAVYAGPWASVHSAYGEYPVSTQYAQMAFQPSPPPQADPSPRLPKSRPVLNDEPEIQVQRPPDVLVSNKPSLAAKPAKDWTRFLLPAFMATTALLTHQLPKRIPVGPASLLPPDWKVWARIGLGIATVNSLNKAFDWKPPAWLVGLETVAVVHPLAVGLSLTTLKQMVVTMPFVAGVVQGTTWLNDQAAEPAKTHLSIPPLVTRLAISAAMLLISVKLFNKVYQPMLSKSFLGKWLGLEALHQTGSAMFATTCARGCTPGGIICLSEAGEILGGLGLKTRLGYRQETRSERA